MRLQFAMTPAAARQQISALARMLHFGVCSLETSDLSEIFVFKSKVNEQQAAILTAAARLRFVGRKTPAGDGQKARA